MIEKVKEIIWPLYFKEVKVSHRQYATVSIRLEQCAQVLLYQHTRGPLPVFPHKIPLRLSITQTVLRTVPTRRNNPFFFFFF